MLEFAASALLLGIKHSFDADHLIAVSSIMSKTRSPRNALRLSLSWCAGHMMGAAAVTIILFAFRDTYLPIILGHSGTLVALMLILFGVMGIWQALPVHTHAHRHGGIVHEHAHSHTKRGSRDHTHRHIFGIGVIQGLASNDELLILLTISLGLGGIAEMAGGIVIFSAGVVVGMLGFALVSNLAVERTGGTGLFRGLNIVIGMASILYGAWMLA